MFVWFRAVQLCFVVLTLLVFSPIAGANTINAASCSQGDVQSAVNSAVNGDRVLVPAGTCNWSTDVSVPSSKRLTLEGAGIDVTTINDTGGDLDINQSGSRVTGFTFECLSIEIDGDYWRIDHNKLTCGSFTTSVEVIGSQLTDNPKGLVDNNEFINTRVLVRGFPANIAVEMWGSTQWYEPLALGTDEAVYVEANTFTFNVFGNAIDCNQGGRYVFRYNTVTDVYLEAHSVQGEHRACRKWEIYENVIQQINRAMWVPMFLRGGTGVVFNNTLTGTWTSPTITVDNVRSFDDRGGDVGQCDGSSPWDGNNEPNGYPCRDQIGRSTDAWLWTSQNPYPPQELDPLYTWNNTHGGNSVVINPVNGSAIHIVQGRDYFNGVQKPGYTPYPYPWSLPAPAAPTNVRITR